jgi:hypothetical protein
MARYRGAVAVVVAAMMKAMTAIYSGKVMWKYLSPVLSACQALIKAVMTARTYGGAVRRRDSTRPYLRVWTTVGKKLVTDADDTMQKSMTI